MPEQKTIKVFDPEMAEEQVARKNRLMYPVMAGVGSLAGFGGGLTTLATMDQIRAKRLVDATKARDVAKVEEILTDLGKKSPLRKFVVPGAMALGALGGMGLLRSRAKPHEERVGIVRRHANRDLALAKRMGYTPELVGTYEGADRQLLNQLRKEERKMKKEAFFGFGGPQPKATQHPHQKSLDDLYSEASPEVWEAAYEAPEVKSLKARLKKENPKASEFEINMHPEMDLAVRSAVGRSLFKKAQDDFLFDTFDDIDPKTEAAINKKLAQERKRWQFKTAVDKMSEQEKQAIIDKAVKSNFDQELDALTSKEKELPPEIQDEMSNRISDALSTAGGMLIVIKPKEFQRTFIRAIGKPELADDLHARGMCFKPGAPPAPDFGLSGSIIPEIMHKLMPLLMGRSAAAPPLARRVTMIKVVKMPENEGAELDHPLMDKISSAYSAYRRDLTYMLPDLVKEAMKHSEYRNFWLDQGPFPGLGVVKEGSDLTESIIQMLPVSYINRAHLPQPASQFIDENCSYDGVVKAASYKALCGI